MAAVTSSKSGTDPAWSQLFSDLTLAVERLNATLVNARDVMRRLNRAARERELDVKVIKPRRGSEHKIVVGGHCKTTVAMHPGEMPTGTLRAIQSQLSHCLGDRWLLT
jgi:hypothetical protein